MYDLLHLGISSWAASTQIKNVGYNSNYNKRIFNLLLFAFADKLKQKKNQNNQTTEQQTKPNLKVFTWAEEKQQLLNYHFGKESVKHQNMKKRHWYLET